MLVTVRNVYPCLQILQIDISPEASYNRRLAMTRLVTILVARYSHAIVSKHVDESAPKSVKENWYKIIKALSCCVSTLVNGSNLAVQTSAVSVWQRERARKTRRRSR